MESEAPGSAAEARAELGAEGSTPPTRQAKRTATTSASGPRRASLAESSEPSSGKGTPSFELSVEALRNEERGRLRVTAQVLIGMASLGLLLTPFMDGDPIAERVFIGGLVWAIVTMGLLLRNSYVSSYNINLIGAGGVSLAIANTCTLYYIGTYSQAAMTGGLGLYIFCLGQSTRWAAAVYGVLAAPHAVLAALIIAKVLPDRGLVSAGDLPVGDQIALHGCVQAVYALAFVAGRASRRKLERVFGELEGATRLIAQRDALLNEAKREIERAVWIGGEGRFTDQVIGSFRLGNVIGRGGMGEVYDAVHVDTNEEAAVKLLQRNVLADGSAIARFAREVKAVASLDSPYVVRVLEVPGENAPLPYLAMERLRGEDLASILRRERRLASRELVLLVQQVGRGLDAARAAGIVHRDIKPQNLFLARSDDGVSTWKVLDFGVSKLAGQVTLTRDQLVGTPDYMAPEQAAGIEVDHRADLYGLAAVLYRCVAARAPFVEQTVAALVHKVINHMPPRPSDFHDGVPETAVTEAQAVGAVRELATLGILTFAVSMAGEDAALRAHLDAVAEAGGTGEPAFTPTTREALVEVLEEIIAGTLTCDVILPKKIVGDPCAGAVRVNGTLLECGGSNGFRVKDDLQTLELLGSACDLLQHDPRAMLKATFPCDEVVL